MKIRYLGNRPALSVCCTGRNTFYFGPENNYTAETSDPRLASQLLGSSQHRFAVVVDEAPIKEEPKKEEVAAPAAETKKKEKKHGKK